jgi:hypothetical protein
MPLILMKVVVVAQSGLIPRKPLCVQRYQTVAIKHAVNLLATRLIVKMERQPEKMRAA